MRNVVNALTVDVEEYFQVTAFNGGAPVARWDEFESRVVPATEEVLSLLSWYETKATFFVVGWVAERHPALVKAIQNEGHEIACHSYAHREISEQTPEGFREDLRRAKNILEDITGKRIRGYRAPTFSVTDGTLWSLDILIEEGFQYDSSIFPIRHDRYGIPGAERFPSVISRGNENGSAIWEFPMSTLRTMGTNLPFSGGGYLRLLPPSVVSWAIEKLNRQGQPAIIYVHPWELDPGQPRLRASFVTRFRHYHNLSQMKRKFDYLLARHKFTTVSQVLKGCAALAEPVFSMKDEESEFDCRGSSALHMAAPRVLAGVVEANCSLNGSMRR